MASRQSSFSGLIAHVTEKQRGIRLKLGRLLKFGCGGLLLLVLVAGVAIWLWKPWASMVPAVMNDPAPIGERVEEGRVLANYYPANGEEPGPAVLVIGGSEGALGNEMTALSKALNAEGFSVLHQSYWRAPGQSEKLERIPLEVFQEGLAWLRARPEVDPERTGMMGWSRGSEATQLVAIRDPQLKAIVLGMPGSSVWPGFSWEAPWAGFDTAWTWQGEDLPYLDFSEHLVFFGGEEEFAEANRKILAMQDDFPETNIPVEDAQAAVMMICGEEDIIWKSCPMARRQLERIRSTGREDVVLLEYSDAGHLAYGAPIATDDPDYSTLGSLGGTAEANAAALEDGFPRIVEFLSEALAAQSAANE